MASGLVPVLNPVTTTGVDALVVVPLPSCPEPLAPQHLAVPSASNAQEWLPPAAIATALVRPVTTAGVVLQAAPLQVCGPVKVPLPNWPKALAPQHLTVPSASNAQEWLPP